MKPVPPHCPLCISPLSQRRSKVMRILWDFWEGKLTWVGMARKYGMTVRSVNHIIRTHTDPKHRLETFGKVKRK